MVNKRSKHADGPPVWYFGESSDRARWTHRHDRVLRLARWVSRQCDVCADSVLEINAKCQVLEPGSQEARAKRANEPTNQVAVVGWATISSTTQECRTVCAVKNATLHTPLGYPSAHTTAVTLQAYLLRHSVCRYANTKREARQSRAIKVSREESIFRPPYS